MPVTLKTWGLSVKFIRRHQSLFLLSLLIIWRFQFFVKHDVFLPLDLQCHFIMCNCSLVSDKLLVVLAIWLRTRLHKHSLKQGLLWGTLKCPLGCGSSDGGNDQKLAEWRYNPGIKLWCSFMRMERWIKTERERESLCHWKMGCWLLTTKQRRSTQRRQQQAESVRSNRWVLTDKHGRRHCLYASP